MSRTSRPLPLLLLVLVCAAALRLWHINAIPPGFHFDEAFEGLEAWRILTEPSYRPIFLTGNFGVPPLNAYANAMSFALAHVLGAEAGPTAMRMTAAVFGVFGVLALYALGIELQRLDALNAPKERLSRYLPLLAAASLAVMRWHIHFSRMGIEPVIVPVIWAASLWALLLAWRTGSWLAYAGTGLVLAAGMYAYQGAWIVPFLVAAAALHLLILAWPHRHNNSRSWQRRVLGLVVAGFVALLFVLPLAWFFLNNPDMLLLRPAQLVIVGETGSRADNSLVRSLVATFSMFAPFGNVGDLDPRRNLPGAPALNLWQALPFYIGLIVALLRIRRPAYSIAVFGLLGLLLPGVFSEYAPHFHRVLGAAAPAALLCGLGLDWLWQRIASVGSTSDGVESRWNSAAAPALVIVLLAGAGFASARDYFDRWATLPDLFYAFDEGLWEIGQYTRELSAREPVYITPRGAEHATIAFAWRERLASPETLPVHFDGRHIFPLSDGVTDKAESYAVIEHEDFRTRLLLPEVFPDAVTAAEFKDRSGEVYARIYERPAGSEPTRPPRVNLVTPLGDGIQLMGYDVLPDVVVPGGSLYVQLHWRTAARPQQEWTVFTHVVNSATGQVVAGHDSEPGAGSLPTSRWQPGWRILDEYEIVLPADLAPGTYDLYAGLYGPSGERLPQDEYGLLLGSVNVE
ncbi:MAG: hypothetical protein ACK2UO_19770 [Caldilineaceae bacterium]